VGGDSRTISVFVDLLSSFKNQTDAVESCTAGESLESRMTDNTLTSHSSDFLLLRIVILCTAAYHCFFFIYEKVLVLAR
jgi:hypothetical protein